MDAEKYLEVLRRLIAQAHEYHTKYSNVHFYEPSFFAVLVFIKSADADSKSLAEQEFVKMLEESDLKDQELIGYCMRELKFESVRKTVLAMLHLEGNSPRTLSRRRMMATFLGAYEETWEYDGTYSFYERKRRTRA